MPRHGEKGRAEAFKIHVERPRRLGGVHDKGDLFFFAEGSDLPDRQDEAKDVGGHGAHDRLRLPDPLREGLQAGLLIEQGRAGDEDLRSRLFQRARHGIVLIAGDEDTRPRFYQRADRDIQSVRRVHGEDDVLRLRDVKKLRRRHPAAKDKLGCPHRRAVPAPAGACADLHGAQHLPAYRGGLDERRRRVIEIDHRPPPPDSSRPPGADRSCR